MCKDTTVLFQSEQEKAEVGKGVRKRQRTSRPGRYSSCTASSAGSCEEDSGGCSNNTPFSAGSRTAHPVMRCVTPRRKRRCAEEITPCEVARGAREEWHRGQVFWGVVQSSNMKDCVNGYRTRKTRWKCSRVRPGVLQTTPGDLPTTQGPANGTSLVTGPNKPGQNGV